MQMRTFASQYMKWGPGFRYKVTVVTISKQNIHPDVWVPR
jgi:hypothetical protein